MAKHDPEHLTTAELAARWGVSAGHLRNLRSAGRGPAWTRPGRVALYSMASVIEHEQSGQRAEWQCVHCSPLRSEVTALQSEVTKLRASEGQHADMGRLLIAEHDRMAAEIERLNDRLGNLRAATP